MTYVLIEGGVVRQKQPYPQDGFIKAPDHIVCGMFYDHKTGGFTTPPKYTTLEEARADKQREINAAYSSELDAILSDYPEAETKTWDKQESEARAYQDDSTASTPLIDAIATARSMDKAELVQRVIAKADAWIALSGAATGKRQALEDAIASTESLEALDAISW
tara:strand:- start:1259 stop:1750 length:492 start_codon:yes stop_codon:yes gene_type:complete